MGGADQYVARLDGVDDLAGGRQAGVGGGDEGADDANGLAVADEALLLVLLDDADAGLTQTVAQDQLELVALVALGDLVAEAGLIDGLVAEVAPNLQGIERGADGLTKAVHAGLIIGLNDLRGSACANDELFDLSDLLSSDFTCHDKFLLTFRFLIFNGLACFVSCALILHICYNSVQYRKSNVL